LTPGFDIWEQFVSVYLAAHDECVSNEELKHFAATLKAGGTYTYFGTACTLGLTAEQLRQWLIARSNDLRVK
jgi:hypothetical protein